jgi:arsenite methyltransferase
MPEVSLLRRSNHPRVHAKLVFLALLLLGGCAALKQCAYEGFNRDQWQQPQQVVAALKLRAGDHVADLGSGSGYFTFYLAKAVGPTGKVYAVDIDREMLDRVAKRAKEKTAGTVQTVLAKTDDPRLPAAGVDLVFTANVYHHIENRIAYFARLKQVLRANGRLAVIDFDRRAWLEGLWHHYTPSEFIKRELEQAGYTLLQKFDFLDRQSFMVFAPMPPAPASSPALSSPPEAQNPEVGK